MSSHIKLLQESNKLSELNNSGKSWVASNLCYEVIMGSTAYGVSNDDSDLDIYAFTMPPYNMLFPYNSIIYEFDDSPHYFNNYQKHHIDFKSKNYDVSVFNIIRYFRLCMDNNPNMIDSLYVPDYCVTYKNEIGELIRDNRDIFLHKGSFHKFKGYAYSQLHKMKIKETRRLVALESKYPKYANLTIEELQNKITQIKKLNSNSIKLNKTYNNLLELNKIYNKSEVPSWILEYKDNQVSVTVNELVELESLLRLRVKLKDSKRLKIVRDYGYDVKFAYHIVRLLNEAEQILTSHTIDLQLNNEQLKSIRRGEWTITQIEEYFDKKQSHLEDLYNSSTLRHHPDQDNIRNLLIDCIEIQYGTLGTFQKVNKDSKILDKIETLLTTR